MKMYYKESLVYKNGLLVAEDGEIINIDPEIVDLANQLETEYQEAAYNDFNDFNNKFMKSMKCDDFTRQSEHGVDLVFNIDTPLMDAKINETIDLMDEIDMADRARQLEERAEGLKPLLDFVNDDYVIGGNFESVHKFDCPRLGNPLNWTPELIGKVLSYIYGFDVNKATTYYPDDFEESEDYDDEQEQSEGDCSGDESC